MINVVTRIGRSLRSCGQGLCVSVPRAAVPYKHGELKESGNCLRDRLEKLPDLRDQLKLLLDLLVVLGVPD